MGIWAGSAPWNGDSGGNDAHDTVSAPTYATNPPTPSPGPKVLAGVEPSSMNNRFTDKAPLIATALLPPTFDALTNAGWGRYALASNGAFPCVAPEMSANVESALTSNGCISAMTGTYIGQAPGTGGTIMVYVQIRSRTTPRPGGSPTTSGVRGRLRRLRSQVPGLRHRREGMRQLP